MRLHTRPLAALALLFLSGGALAAEPVALLPASGANVDAGTLSAANEVFRSYVDQAGEFTLRPARGGTTSPVELLPSEAAQAAAEVGAGQAAALRLAALGSVITVRLTVYGAPDGRTLWTDSLQAGSAADLDPVLKRLAVGWSRGTKAVAAAEIDTVTDREAKALNKKQATKQRGLRLGVVKGLNTADGSDPTGKGIGTYWLYDARSFLVDVTTDLYWGGRLNNFAIGFGGYVPLTSTDLAPYLGGGLRYGWTRLSGDWASGFQPYVAGGLMVGRLSSVGFRAEVSWHWDLYETAGQNSSLLIGSVAVQF
ncbi:MAG: hypothetical protein U0229_24515 [Anaeromyxobacter sp.]